MKAKAHNSRMMPWLVAVHYILLATKCTLKGTESVHLKETIHLFRAVQVKHFS